MFDFLLCLALTLSAESLLQVNAETTTVATNHTHHHHEQTEMENFSFNYDGVTHMLMVMTGTKCYIWTLNHKQQQAVHTDDGLRALELQVLGDIDKALYTVVPKTILASSIQHACGRHASTFYLVH